MAHSNMEQENYFNETEYIAGFNLGYRIAKEFPELADVISQSNSKSDKFDGLKDGRQQFLEENDKIINQEKVEKKTQPSWLTGDRLKNDNKSVNIEKDNDLEKE